MHPLDRAHVRFFTGRTAHDRFLDGAVVGSKDGAVVGWKDGAVVGSKDGAAVGRKDGAVVGAVDGALDGLSIFIINSLNFLKFSTPRPVTGSHPGAAEKPSLQQVGGGRRGGRRPYEQWLSPEVMSLVKFLYDAYKMGLIQPTDGRPARRRAALTRDIMPATTGADADVPATYLTFPPIVTWYL